MVCPPTLKKNGVRKSALFLYKEEIIKTFLGEKKENIRNTVITRYSTNLTISHPCNAAKVSEDKF